MNIKERLEQIDNLLANPNLEFEEKVMLKDKKLELEREIGKINNGEFDYEECENCSA